MRVVNRDADTVIPHVTRKDSFLQKFWGLRFQTDGRAWFVFDDPVHYRFDMVFVPRPLDIAFVDADNTIMEIHGALPVTHHPDTWRFYQPEQPYKYVLEVEHGLLPEKQFDEGDEIVFVE